MSSLFLTKASPLTTLMSQIIAAVANNPMGVFMAYIQNAVTISGIVAVNTYMEEFVSKVLPAGFGRFKPIIVDTLKHTNLIFFSGR